MYRSENMFMQILREAVDAAHQEYFLKQQEVDWKALLSVLPVNQTLISTYGKKEVIQICREKLLELTPDFEHENREYSRCSKVALIRNLAGPLWKLYFQYREEYITSLKKQIDRLSLLYLTAVDKVPKTSGLTDEQIQQARIYPTHELYSGKLLRSGRNWKCLCPFHEERTPSFYFYTEENSWYCFGCHVGGRNAIDYLMKLENLPFKESVSRLI